MFPIRIKLGPARNNEWRCCFCLHVRTATILLGIWHLMLHVLALSVLVLLMRTYHIMMQYNNDVDPGNLLPTPLSKVKDNDATYPLNKAKDNDNPYALPTTQEGRAIYPSDIDMGALVTICTLAITLLLVYGTIKGKATHLLPFFCLQLFDFAITTLTATGYFCYLQSVHQFVNESWRNMPYHKELLQLSPQALSLLVLASFLVSMLWKAYCISIVWRCYKFLTIRQQTIRSAVHYILPDGNERMPEPDYSSLLPDYEAACASVMKQPPPPSYQAAMEGQQPPTYPEAIHVLSVAHNCYDLMPESVNANETNNDNGVEVSQNDPSDVVDVQIDTTETVTEGDEGACSNCSNNNKGDDNKEIVLEEDKTVDVELKVAEDNVEKSKEN